jgi:hypothetical protein
MQFIDILVPTSSWYFHGAMSAIDTSLLVAFKILIIFYI